MRLLDVAKAWQAEGVSVIPILGNRSKRPAVQWAQYIAEAPTLGQLDEWWANGHSYGLAVICGAVSGNLEMLELEAEACDSASLTKLQDALQERGAWNLWNYLIGPGGYTESSPTGGLHLIYRIEGAPVPGNTKIASRPDPVSRTKVLAETRGEGGYVIVAPTSGICHPSGDSWDLVNGTYGKVASITWQERCLLHEAIKEALDQMPAPSTEVVVRPAPAPSIGGRSPGDDFEEHTDWAEILEPHGWTLESRRGPERHWTRPGKDRRDGASATTGRAHDRDRLYVFSTSTVFESEVPYTKFGAFALLNFGGDHHRAAQALVKQGFGERAHVPALPSIDLGSGDLGRPEFARDEIGNAERMAAKVVGKVLYVAEEKQYYVWQDTTWGRDIDGAVNRYWRRLTEEMIAEGEATDDDRLVAWAHKSRAHAKETAALKMFKSEPGMTVSVNAFNPERHKINLRNGVLDLDSGELHPHQPSFMMTRTFGASYDPQAVCPNFESFMERALPDPTMRSYVQRALGFTLLGDSDERAIFLIHGPSGTGKSTLMETIQRVFGDYGATAPASTFKASRSGDKAPSNDLHRLRGRRFVSTSETSESATFDEDLLKRVSGKDTITSRALYQEYIEWVPEFCLWLATNNPPRFNVDDDAIWRRAKLVPFETVFLGEGEVMGFSERVLAPEADGILNWLLAGLRAYMENGLDEPEQIQEEAVEQRLLADTVSQFLLDRMTDNLLVKGEGASIRSAELYSMYQTWCNSMHHRAVGAQRFHVRVGVNFRTLQRVTSNGQTFWRGIGRSPGSSILGSFSLALDQG